MAIDPAGNDLTTDEVFCIKIGFLNMWVCAPKHFTLEQVQEGVDKLPPAGTSHGWQVERREDGDEDQRSPGLCADDETRQHWNYFC